LDYSEIKNAWLNLNNAFDLSDLLSQAPRFGTSDFLSLMLDLANRKKRL
jgi:hypothetical protein